MYTRMRSWCGVLALYFVSLIVSGVVSLKYERSVTTQQASNHTCLPWSELTDNGTCECNSFFTRTPKTIKLQCLNNIPSLPYCYCMSYNEKFKTTVVGFCRFRCYVLVSDPGRHDYNGINKYQIIVKSRNWTEFNDNECSSLQMYRTGQMCGSCVKGFAPPVYSYSLACVNCTDYKYNWIKYIAVAYLPLTVFFVIVITFRISAVSGATNGFILTSQIIASLPVMEYYLESYYYSQKVSLKICATFYGIWNLDFFRALYTPFCLHPNMTAIQTRALDYAIAVYPLVLVVITYIFASLHYRYPRVVSLWRPFYRCFRCIRNEWDIKNTLIGAFATFILLSYVKILNISLELLMPVILYDMKGQALKQLYLNMDGTVEYFGNEHLPYGLLALVMALLFNILPLMLLCLFPCRCFHRCLNHFQIQRETLRECMVVFYGEFKDQPRDYRYFAAIYLLLRIFNLLLFFFANGILYFQLGTVLFAATSVIIAVFKPYRKSFHNHTDSLLIFVLAVASIDIPTRSLFKSVGGIQPLYIVFFKLVWALAISIHPLYGIGMLISIFFPVRKVKERAFTVLVRLYNFIRGTASEPEDRLPYRLEHMDEYPPLIPKPNH